MKRINLQKQSGLQKRRKEQNQNKPKTRYKLQKHNSKRRVFTGQFERIGKKHGSQSGATLLLTNIKDHRGDVICDHLWVNYTKGIARLNSLFPGDVLKFKARVKTYQHATEEARQKKGHLTEEDYYEEYGLSHPSNYQLVTKVKPPQGKERQNTSWMTHRKDFSKRINRFAKYWSYYLNQ